MNELKNFKDKKLAEFQNKFADIEMGNFYNEEQVWKHTIGKPYFVEQFISDLIDEIEKAIPEEDKKTYQDFSSDGEEGETLGLNKCRDEFLTNLNS